MSAKRFTEYERGHQLSGLFREFLSDRPIPSYPASSAVCKLTLNQHAASVHIFVPHAHPAGLPRRQRLRRILAGRLRNVFDPYRSGGVIVSNHAHLLATVCHHQSDMYAKAQLSADAVVTLRTSIAMANANFGISPSTELQPEVNMLSSIRTRPRLSEGSAEIFRCHSQIFLRSRPISLGYPCNEGMKASLFGRVLPAGFTQVHPLNAYH